MLALHLCDVSPFIADQGYWLSQGHKAHVLFLRS
jgi:hypothetical protein